MVKIEYVDLIVLKLKLSVETKSKKEKNNVMNEQVIESETFVLINVN
jgi:hypothetical protein